MVRWCNGVRREGVAHRRRNRAPLPQDQRLPAHNRKLHLGVPRLMVCLCHKPNCHWKTVLLRKILVEYLFYRDKGFAGKFQDWKNLLRQKCVHGKLAIGMLRYYRKNATLENFGKTCENNSDWSFHGNVLLETNFIGTTFCKISFAGKNLIGKFVMGKHVWMVPSPQCRDGSPPRGGWGGAVMK